VSQLAGRPRGAGISSEIETRRLSVRTRRVYARILLFITGLNCISTLEKSVHGSVKTQCKGI